ncbi:hypothetical protein [Bacillus horti]|uniref:Transposase n=1 Tax=Caldalkalibacillus horti TaxID=77523 RepID=A0ABT9W4M6_9BACI|nr:hypothetical protein [Bacillus horti]MDQ0168202.1 hypothetical protein [Bacillus horti]
MSNYSSRTVFLAMQDKETAENLVKITHRTTQLQRDLLVHRHNLSDSSKSVIQKQIRLLKLQRDYILSFFDGTQTEKMEVI